MSETEGFLHININLEYWKGKHAYKRAIWKSKVLNSDKTDF